jgi:hypothetical protein
MSRKERIDSASPAGQEELKAHEASRIEGTDKPPTKRREAKRNPPEHTIETPTFENPKKTGQKPREA